MSIEQCNTYFANIEEVVCISKEKCQYKLVVGLTADLLPMATGYIL